MLDANLDVRLDEISLLKAKFHFLLAFSMTFMLHLIWKQEPQVNILWVFKKEDKVHFICCCPFLQSLSMCMSDNDWLVFFYNMSHTIHSDTGWNEKYLQSPSSQLNLTLHFLSLKHIDFWVSDFKQRIFEL